MHYESSTALRRALEDRLRRHALTARVPLARLRKMVAFERFLARLVKMQPDAWVLKGGLALQFRLGERARTTQDMDLSLRETFSGEGVHDMLVAAAFVDLGDWFLFEVARPADPAELRFPVQSLLDGRLFESFHIDVGLGDPITEPADILITPSLLAFAGFAPVVVPAYPLAQQIAEKVHALTRLYASGESSRVRDWVDILLMARWENLRAGSARQALLATFDRRGTHPLPKRMPRPPASWSRAFRRLRANRPGIPHA